MFTIFIHFVSGKVDRKLTISESNDFLKISNVWHNLLLSLTGLGITSSDGKCYLELTKGEMNIIISKKF